METVIIKRLVKVSVVKMGKGVKRVIMKVLL